ncbi:hypothetical protein [Lacrimispora indolis]|uniref:hypothetical protein n=1 Tax=Lacrimispora indolis TaxID=69825 RepID=UPI00042941EA|nr:hypothetical protein [[Clostridium] methoxybenzovorans]
MGDDMTAAEKQLERECELYRMRAAELEKKEIVLDKVMDIIDNAKQGYHDVVWSGTDFFTGIAAQNKWKALDDLQHEIEEMLE